ncbi:alpha/beta hydrolase [Vallicoccus soli]|uniref:alpha/beta hydrolase n=1 Tax=Vallicoccus soli TaxID=2339232 RepID=UPI001C49C28D|nr:alpha/beta hydrolase [Vallicoccus soli]
MPPEEITSRYAVSERRVGDFTCYTVAPPGGDFTHAVLYLHGGSYINEITSQHWSFIARLVEAGARAEVPIYGLAPQHTYREAYPLLIDVYRDLLGDLGSDDAEARAGGSDGVGVSVVGDSAGAGLALGFAQSLQAARLPQPRQLVLLSPWLDLTLSNPDILRVQRRDPWLSRVGLLEVAKAWSGGDDPTDFRLSPLNGPLAGLPPVAIYVGTRDILHPDAVKLRDRLEAAGVPVRLEVAKGAFHVYVLAPVPEGRRAASTIVRDLAPAGSR